MRQRNSSDIAIQRLFSAWCEKECRSHYILDDVHDNMADPRYAEAAENSTKALLDFLCKPTSSLYGILLKLKVACHYDDYVAEALDPACNLIAPRAIIAAMHDMENLIIVRMGDAGKPIPEQETPHPAADAAHVS